MIKYCYLNGRFILENKASVSVFDIGLLRGFAAFDFMRSYNGKVLLFDEHLNRLTRSAKILNIKISLTRVRIKEIIEKLLRKNKLKEAGIRIIITGGQSVNGISYNYDTPTFLILTQALPQYRAALYERGAKLITYEHGREIPRAKTTNYLTLLKLQNRKIRSGAAEVLYIAKGNILEGATSNFFIFKDDTLITAKDNILWGTRRKLVLKLARKKFKVSERTLLIAELKGATEAFITSTTREILPIVKIDNVKIGDGKVGQNTKELMNLFSQYVQECCLKV
jgi:branched-chain amino acid aminotransferase